MSRGLLGVLAGLLLLLSGAAAPAYAQDEMRLADVTVDPRGHGPHDGWTIPDKGGNVMWNASFGEANYLVRVPETVALQEPTVTLYIDFQAYEGQRFAPAMAIDGRMVKEGRTQTPTVIAESGERKNTEVVVHLLNANGTSVVTIGIQDGPLYTFTYHFFADTSPKGTCTRALRGAHAAAINEVRIVSCRADCAVHREGAPDEEWIPCEVGMVLKQGDEISLDPDGNAVLAFADNSRVTVRNTTQLKIASFFTEGGVVRTEILLKMGEVAAKVNKSEATKSDFKIKSATGTAGVRGTEFTVRYDPGSRAMLVKVKEGTVEVDPVGAGLATVNVGAGREVEATPRAITKVVRAGRAGLRGGISRFAALDLVAKLVAKAAVRCKTTTPRTGATTVKPGAGGWAVAIRLTGGLAGTGRWTVKGRRVQARNAVAKAIARGCR